VVNTSSGKTRPVLQIKVSSLPYGEELKRRDLEGEFGQKGKKGETISISGREGVKVVSGNRDQTIISVFLPAGDKTIIILGFPNVVTGQNFNETIRQMISTFTLPPSL